MLRGIPRAIRQVFPDTEFISTSSGWDLNQDFDKFRAKIKDYNVFINVAQLATGSQVKLLEIVGSEWQSGWVFNIGSVAEYKKWEWLDPGYTQDKRLLRDTSIELCSEHLKTTHITVGGFKDESNESDTKMDPLNIANTIRWIIDSDFHVPVIGIEQIRDEVVKKWKNKQNEI